MDGFSQDENEDVVDVDEYTDEDEVEVIPDDDEDIENVFVQEENKLELNVGMIFDSVADLFEYYLKYGNENGFPVKKRSSRTDDNGEELNEDEGAWGSSLPNSLSGIEHHDRSSSHDIIPMCKQNGIVRSPLAVRSNIGRPPFKRKESKGEQVVRKKKEQEKKVREKEKEVSAGSVFGNLNSDKDSTGGLEVIELGGTQESITMKDHGRNAPHANHPYNSIDVGFPLHLQCRCLILRMLQLQENGDNFPRAYPPNNFLVTMRALKTHLDRTKNLPFVKKISDFRLLFLLSRFPNANIPALAECVQTETSVPEGCQLLIDSMANAS
ncbi:hypothetical protein IFM89_032494 [Coptis chinensis]|uniref:Uncharacterized protein n=1 Tax=Coptis chinensis TaxID=261450 RepID=A0A835IP75_9MAGN|nr:hypothetical protein IFM89_032494 [Coptis chinensis]